jgi:PKD repeat protein
MLSLASSPASADTAPQPPTTLTTVSADGLPTVQVNGVVWDQVIVGNTVYATGEFTSARPAGAAAGTDETPRSNILAYNLATGALISTWAPTLNAQGKSIVASTDGTRIFVGGSFTSVSGVNRYRVVALDATTGAVIPSWNVVSDSRVRSLAISGDTLYMGGIFSTISGQPRNRLAAVSASTGAVLAWAPTADAEPLDLVAPAGSGKVVAAGKFTVLSGTPAYGMGALDATTGAVLPWAIGATVRDAGDNAAIFSLSTDGAQVYGTGYTFGSGGNLEGSFAARSSDGSLVYVNGCLGDTYDSAPVGGVLYDVAHAHNCSSVGANPEVTPRAWQRAAAQSTAPAASGLVNNGGNFNGLPAPEVLHWLPTLEPGTYTGQDQAAWNVKATSDYVVLGGEFTKVNSVAQQGLVRFAVSSIAPNKQGPQGGSELTPTITGTAPGTVRISWKSAWDRDNLQLTYQVLRGPTLASSVPVATLTQDTAWWSRPTLSFTDETVPGGSTQTYRIRVKDAFGNTVNSDPASGTVPVGALSTTTYPDKVRADGAGAYWRLGEATGAPGYDWAGNNDLALASTATRRVPGALVNDSDAAVTFPGSGALPAVAGQQLPAPQVFTEEAWFKTTSTSGGKIVGFGNSQTGASGTSDRHIYLTNNGRLAFGVISGTVQVLTSTGTYNNGQWHHVVATMSPAGMRLYADGALVGSNAVTSAQSYKGYWRIDGDAISTSWPNRPTSTALAGSIDDVAVYPTALSAGDVTAHRQLGLGTGINRRPTASFVSNVLGLSASFDATGSSDPDGTVTSYSWDFGDGSTGTGATAAHSYTAGGTYQVQLSVTDSGGATGVVSRPVTAVAPANQPPSASFSSSVSGLAASFDATGSSDPDGTIASYAWDFGDGSTGTGATPTHTYTADGTYPVQLTVTDDDGATGTTTKPVTVAASTSGAALATDTFERTVSSGWGSADVGGAWTLSASGSALSVAAGSGQASIPAGRTVTAKLNAVQNQDTDLTAQFWSDNAITGGGTYLSTIVRTSSGGDYRTRLKLLATGVVQASVTSVVGATETALTSAVTVPGVTYTPGAKLLVRTQATGSSPTTIRYRVWLQGTTEPSTWLQTVSDSTAGLQTSGAVGLIAYVSSSATQPQVLHVDNVSAVKL